VVTSDGDFPQVAAPNQNASGQGIALAAHLAAGASHRATRTMLGKPVVFVLDDHDALRDSLTSLLQSAGLRTRGFASPQEFLEDYDPSQPGCLVADVWMPGMNGLELLAHLHDRNIPLPIVFVSGQGDIATAVQAVRAGAVNFLEKPVCENVLLASVHQALALDRQARAAFQGQAALDERYARLSGREREVLDLLVKGHTNKAVAARLGVACKTVEFHRRNIMVKMEAASFADLLRLQHVRSKPGTKPRNSAGDG
jgi:FixJ family two-component response regulator